MDIDNDYPSILYGDLPMFARLLTVIHVACIDVGGGPFGVVYDDNDLQKFFDVSGHQYFSVKPTGNIKKAVSMLTKAVLAGVEKGEMELAVTRRNLAGDLSLLNSWVDASDFEEWCSSRGLSLGESWFELWKDDQEIFEAAAETQDSKRREYEGRYEQDDIQSLREKVEEDGVDFLFTQIAALRYELKQYKSKDIGMVERPLLTKERNVLLAVVAALCKDAGYDTSKPAKTAVLIQSTAAKMGLSIGESTIENHLKKIPDALATRMK